MFRSTLKRGHLVHQCPFLSGQGRQKQHIAWLLLISPNAYIIAFEAHLLQLLFIINCEVIKYSSFFFHSLPEFRFGLMSPRMVLVASLVSIYTISQFLWHGPRVHTRVLPFMNLGRCERQTDWVNFGYIFQTSTMALFIHTKLLNADWSTLWAINFHSHRTSVATNLILHRGKKRELPTRLGL